ncbi:MAG: LpqB family beta-propeller domain-containing protein [Myxococcota bacterium]
MFVRILGAAVLSLFVLSSCELFGGGGGGGGTGGGGGSSLTFTKGFAFTRKDDRNVYLVDDADVQTTTTLTQSANVRTPAFSRDGKRIVFVRGGTMDAELATVATTGGVISTVLTSSSTARNFKTPVFSPDGTRIAFGFDEGTTTGVALINVDGTGFQKLANGGLAQAFPSFTPDGTEVVVAAGNPGLGYTQIERITLATSQVTNVTNTLGNEAQGIVNRLLVSPDGTKAVFDGRISTGVTRLFVIDLSTKQVTLLYAGEAGTNDSFPCWMSATTVAFSSDSGGNDNVYKVTLPSSSSASLLVPKAIEPWYFTP